MTTILTVVFFLVVAFDVFMVTPFGMYWTMHDLDNGHCARGIIIAFCATVPAMIIGGFLGFIK